MGQRETADARFAAEVEAVLAASRVLVGVAAQSIAAVENTVSVSQLRALVIIATRGPIHLSALAQQMEVHPSNATRACDGLVTAGLLDRRDNPADRRHLALALTPAGQTLIDKMLETRRSAIAQILHRMPPEQRTQLALALQTFADAGGEPAERDLWILDWVS